MKMEEIYQKIAIENDATVEDVEREIQKAIECTVQDEEVPTVEEFIHQILLEVEVEKEDGN